MLSNPLVLYLSDLRIFNQWGTFALLPRKDPHFRVIGELTTTWTGPLKMPVCIQKFNNRYCNLRTSDKNTMANKILSPSPQFPSFDRTMFTVETYLIDCLYSSSGDIFTNVTCSRRRRVYVEFWTTTYWYPNIRENDAEIITLAKFQSVMFCRLDISITCKRSTRLVNPQQRQHLSNSITQSDQITDFLLHSRSPFLCDRVATITLENRRLSLAEQFFCGTNSMYCQKTKAHAHSLPSGAPVLCSSGLQIYFTTIIKYIQT